MRPVCINAYPNVHIYFLKLLDVSTLKTNNSKLDNKVPDEYLSWIKKDINVHNVRLRSVIISNNYYFLFSWLIIHLAYIHVEENALSQAYIQSSTKWC